MSPLAQLATDLRAEGRPSLAWVTEHAAGGDLDEALRRAWAAAPADPAAFYVVQEMAMRCRAIERTLPGVAAATEATRALDAHWRLGNCPGLPGDWWPEQPCCLRAYRRRARCPSLAAFVAVLEATHAA